MRKKLFLLITILVMCMPAMGEGIDRNAALKKAQVFMPGKQFVAGKTMRSARAKGARRTDAFYIFNVKDDGGFVIVSGDDRTSDILAYSKHGNLDIDEMPENMKWWLDEYARQIEALDTSLQPAVRRAQAYPEAIAPLITTNWNQGTPYNNMCPDNDWIDYDEPGFNPEKRSLTGCVATTIAQIMYYWHWPETCPAIDGYGNEVVSLRALPATTFKWDLMKESYLNNDTGPAVDAVAELMRYCGQAMKMSYSMYGSATYLKKIPMNSVFQYSPNCVDRARDAYTVDHWESIIYDELKARRPVPYSGNSDGGSHQFIVDGYDGNGMFHFNWGWGGYADTYGVLSLADTKSGNGSFRFSQNAVTGLKPAEGGEQIHPRLLLQGDTSPLTTYNRSSASVEFSDVSFSMKFVSIYDFEPAGDLTAEISWGLYQNGVLIRTLTSQQTTFLASNSGWESHEIEALANFGADLPLGTYQIYPSYRFEGETEWQRFESYNTMLIAEVTDTTLKLSHPDGSVMSFCINSITLPDEPETNVPTSLSVNVTNTGGSQHLVACLWVQKGGESEWSKWVTQDYYLGLGESNDMPISITPTESGSYNLKITAGDDPEALATATMDVAGQDTIIIDGVYYLCTPNYRRAIVIENKKADKTQKAITIHPTVTARGVECQVKAIADRAFHNWYNLTSVVIPEGVESIGSNVFSYAYDIVTIELPSTLKSIGDGAFMQVTDMATVISKITDPFVINDNTFALTVYNQATNRLDILPNRAKLYVPIGSGPKYEALSGWAMFADIQEGVPTESMVDGLRYAHATGGTKATVIRDPSYDALTSVTIPSNVTIDGRNYRVTAIGRYAFSMSELTSISLPEGIEAIDEGAFAHISSLTTVELPASLKEIGNEAFEFLYTQLTSVVSHIQDPFDIPAHAFAKLEVEFDPYQVFFHPLPATLYVPVGTKALYEARTGWNMFADIVEGVPTGIEPTDIEPAASGKSLYDLSGRQITHPTKGINIIRNSDGTTKKVLVK